MVHLSRVAPATYAAALRDEALAFFTIAHASLPALRRTQGNVVAVTTAATARYPVRDGLSAGTKGAVEQLVRAFAAEEGRFGVRFNCVGPGMLTDGMAARLIDSGGLDERVLEITPRQHSLGPLRLCDRHRRGGVLLGRPAGRVHHRAEARRRRRLYGLAGLAGQSEDALGDDVALDLV